MRRAVRNRRKRLEGITLIELMVVIVLVAIASVAAVVALGSITRSELRGACLKVVAASRFSYSRASTTGNTVRIVLNLDNNTMSIEETEGTVSLSAADDERRGDNSERDTAAVDPWEAASARIEETFEPSFGETSFQPVRGRDGITLQKYLPQPLMDDIEIIRVYTPHDPDPIESGVAAVYYFPSGMAEEAVIHLAPEGSDTIFSVLIHPLTGHAQVVAEERIPDELNEDYFEESESDVRDPG